MLSGILKCLAGVSIFVLLAGCASTVNFAPQPYSTALGEVPTGEFMQSLTYRRDVPVYFSLDPKNSQISIEQIDGKMDLVKLYKENAAGHNKNIKDCVLLKADGKYALCGNQPDVNKDEYLSVYHQNRSLYDPVTAVVATAFNVGLLWPLGTAVSILTFDSKHIKKAGIPYYERQYSNERVIEVGQLVDKRLTSYLRNRLAGILEEKDPAQFEEYYLYYKNHAKSKEIRGRMIALYEERAEKKQSTLDYVKAFEYYESRNLDLIKKADKYAVTDKDHAAVEYAVINKSKNKGAFFSIERLGNNVNAENVALGGNLFVMNISSKGIKNATGRFKISLAENSEFPIAYGNYFVDVKARLTTRYQISSGLVGTKNTEDVTEKTVRVKLNRNNSWNAVTEVDFGEVVQSGGSAVFGFKIMDIKLTGADVAYSVGNVEGVYVE